MGKTKAVYLFATLLVVGSVAGAYCQGVGDTDGVTTSRKLHTGTGAGGTAASGSGVRTGKGPLSKSVPPAVSTTNPQQDPRRPLNSQGAVPTNPPTEPFGSR